MQTADDAIARYGDQAYHCVTQLVSIATTFGDDSYARKMAAISIELIARGYHKHPQK